MCDIYYGMREIISEKMRK